MAEEPESIISGAEADSEDEQESCLESSYDKRSEDIQSTTSESSSVISIVERLHSPTPSDLARKRKLQSNPPPKGSERGKGTAKANPKCCSI